jgi:hypothetical protein
VEYNIHELVRLSKTTTTQINGVWMPARPEGARGFYGFKLRVKAAWKVLTGKGDVIIWGGNQ